MIKDIITIIVISLIVVASHVLIQNVMDKNSEDLIKQLSSLREEIENTENNDDEVKEKANNIYTTWTKKSGVWATIIDHQDVEQIEKLLINVKSAIETKETEEAIQKIEESKFYISLVQDKEKLKIKNIF